MFCSQSFLCDSNYKPEEKPQDEIKRIEADELIDFNYSEKKFVNKALDLQYNVLKTKRFEDKFMKMKWTQDKGKSNEELWEELNSGYSTYTPVEDFTLDYCLTLFDARKRKTIGLTKMQSGKIFINRYHFKKWMIDGEEGLAHLSGHLLHEYLHSMKYSHRGLNKRKSFVYRAGYLMRAEALVYLGY